MKLTLPTKLPSATCRVQLPTPLLHTTRLPSRRQTRRVVSMASMSSGKREGDISDAFASMSGKAAEPLPDRYRQLKLRLVQGHEQAVIASWKRLLDVLRRENEVIAQRGPSIVPEIRFSCLEQDIVASKPELKKRGVAVIKGVVPEDEARAYKYEIEEYVRQNPHTRGASFSSDTMNKVSLGQSSKSGWGSKKIGILIRQFSGNGYNALVFKQSCKECNKLRILRLDEDSYVERVVYRLKKWAGIHVEKPVYSGEHGKPHETELCEACRAGYYCQRAAIEG